MAHPRPLTNDDFMTGGSTDFVDRPHLRVGHASDDEDDDGRPNLYLVSLGGGGECEGVGKGGWEEEKESSDDELGTLMAHAADCDCAVRPPEQPLCLKASQT